MTTVNLIPEFRTWLLTQGTFPYESGECYAFWLPDKVDQDSCCAIRMNGGPIEPPLKRMSVEIESKEKDGMQTALSQLDLVFALVNNMDNAISLGGYKTRCQAQSTPFPAGYDDKNYAHALLYVELITVA